MQTHSEQDIVAGCVSNNRYFQEVLYRRYFNTMLGMCMRYTNDRDRALEIINNGFLKVFKKIDTFSFKGSLEGWIRRIVYHSLSDYFKGEAQYLKLMVFEEKESNQYAYSTDKLYTEDILNMVRKLPPASQEVFRLYAIEGYSHAEIGEILGISVGTSKWHLSNAREKLKEMLNRENRMIG